MRRLHSSDGGIVTGFLVYVATKSYPKYTEKRLARWRPGTIMVATVGLSVAVRRTLLP